MTGLRVFVTNSSDGSIVNGCNGTIAFGRLSGLVASESGCVLLPHTNAFAPTLIIANLLPDLSTNNFLFIENQLLKQYNRTSLGAPTSSLLFTFKGEYKTSLNLSAVPFSLCPEDKLSSRCLNYTFPPSFIAGAQESAIAVVTVDGITALLTYSRNFFTTPALIDSAYNVTSNVGHVNATQLIYAAINQTFSPSDLSLFQSDNNIPQNAVTFDINGHSSDATCAFLPDDCGEANLDVQVLTSLSQEPSPTEYYYDGEEGFLFEWLLAMADLSLPPLVSSISYGADEAYLTYEDYDLFNLELVKLGLKGCTVVTSSGDDGAVSQSVRNSTDSCGYMPSFPATCPYITAVGASFGIESGQLEQGCNSAKGGIITSGGGFSYFVERPLWQASAVESYLLTSSGRNAAAGFNSSGRGLPDISLLGYNYDVVVGGVHQLESGTSASAPAFAAFVSLVNAARFRVGKGPIGFLNPILYAFAANFTNDITIGDNICAAYSGVGTLHCCAEGFSATTGWDPVTGLGSIDFSKFVDTLVSLGPNHYLTQFPTATPTGDD